MHQLNILKVMRLTFYHYINNKLLSLPTNVMCNNLWEMKKKEIPNNMNII